MDVLISLLFCLFLIYCPNILSALTGAKYFAKCLVCKDTRMGKTWALPSGNAESDKDIQTNTQERITNVGLIQNPVLGTSIEMGLPGTRLMCVFLIGMNQRFKQRFQ